MRTAGGDGVDILFFGREELLGCSFRLQPWLPARVLRTYLQLVQVQT